MPTDADRARLQRESEFHDRRYTEESRTAQGKYYSALRDCFSTYKREVRDHAHGADVLEYGCATGKRALELATSARSVTGIDISEVAIEQAQAAAATLKLANANFVVMNAEQMDFADDTFDVVFGSGIIHHLDVERSLGEIARVLRPGGTAMFVEPLGTNALVNLYRRRTPGARSPDEHPLVKDDLEVARRQFRDVRADFYGLTTLLSVPFRSTRAFGPLYTATSALDRAMFKLDLLRWQSWYVYLELQN